MNADFDVPVSPSQEPPKKNNTLIIIIVVALILLCCCCVAAGLAWTYGDTLLEILNI